ncbi:MULTISPECIES: hypothetical protein [unclassified Streptomyces]|uniref:hypothetical protein n=1 Tax=unclassified Streptomyces TaxID=2593676 RepID=UPI003720D2E4
MSAKTKMQLFMGVVALVTVLALIQGLMAEGSGRTVPLVVAALGALSLVMWGMALRGSRRG